MDGLCIGAETAVRFYVLLVLNWPGETGNNFLPAPFFPRKSIDRASSIVVAGGVTSPGPSVPSGLLVRGR